MYIIDRVHFMQNTICPERRQSVEHNNHQSNVSHPNATPPVCRHFAQSKHDFNTHAKFTLIETITNRNNPTEVIQDILRKRENFWINTLETLYPLAPHPFHPLLKEKDPDGKGGKSRNL